ncbi:alpha/beta fold hydrolase [Parasphingopyxis algicola]|uniref:alpha/beta fold hydrolase n=1 Tax=Parasphingopyxis algicola TaxID=2026624 RepID=UPI0015A4175D|nr:alpha/beta fold hydrolase [Parasphingopyxis algicola]QLC26410.1 alpha/beta fold hydrolase [Parasphingopyxis algicola]
MSSVTDTCIDLSGLQLSASVIASGDRPWLTLLHSLATDSRLWQPQVEPLARSFNLLLLDMRGHGKSAVLPPPYSWEDLVGDVLECWNNLGIRRSAVLGLSIGGMVALGLALDHRNRVTRIVAADCRADAPDWFRDMFGERQEMVRERGMAGVLEPTLASWLTEPTRTERPDIVEAATEMILNTSVDGYLGATEALKKLAFLPRLAEIETPALLVVGEEDGPHPAAMAEMADAIGGARLETIAGAAHLSNLERSETFTGIVAGWLEEAIP